MTNRRAAYCKLPSRMCRPTPEVFAVHLCQRAHPPSPALPGPPRPAPAAIFYALTFPVQRPQLFVLSWPYFPQLQVCVVCSRAGQAASLAGV